ncbi:Outer membrane receptor proteins, mostly Fe transport [Dyadobacter koreensis]|uniref:Outer membrane receptor proteins, mostly Fe transport n=1 Tax=Dyadobacter koreensis TaxID=408657 RepID=A0A1H6ZBN5_9BACT|nr:TonB-dependent receptor [Dyadobacter koreensis]SEJ50849.1 Outer membrane receptor proteins, mostly Fe transport [Dyadobacter koreensis]
MRSTCTLFLLLFSFIVRAQERITISGFVREQGSQEQLPGVNVYIPDTPYGAVTNTYGFYSLTLPAMDSALVVYSFVGYETVQQQIRLNKNTELSILLATVNQLDEVTVTSRRQEDYVSRSAQMSQVEIPISQIKKIPAFFGEKDVLKVLQLMPGVQKGTEGQTGLYVRGGGPDQNLIILDDAVVYNANHLFGFFSIFNSDALKSVELTKGGFPARYGGRLSSVLEMNMKEGNKEALHGEGGIGIISSRLTLEGPISKGKSSFLVSARRTYIDILAAPLIARDQRDAVEQVKPGYYFYDINAKINYDLGSKDKVYLSGYFGHDNFYANETSPTRESRAGLDWGNKTATLRWNHLLNQKLFVNTSFIYSNFDFGVSNYNKDINTDATIRDEFSLNYTSQIRDWGIKTDLDYYPSPKHAVKFGAQATFHRFVPSALALQGSLIDESIERSVTPINTLEGGIYIEDTWQPFDALKMNAGFRLSTFQTESKTYFRPEPRFSAALRLAEDFSFKASYAQMNQYVHLLSNTGLGLPTDLWVPTTDKVAPQQSKQVAIGLAKDLEKPALTLTLEGYYKKMGNILNYKEGASFLSISGENANELSWEDNVTAGKGWSYGTEFLVHKKTGRFSGWVGYTLSWTKWQFPELNFGRTFYPRYDRRHDLSVVGIYELTKRITVSATWVYGTGNALTLPRASFTGVTDNFFTRFSSTGTRTATSWSGNQVTEYGDKNSFRAEPFHRLDLAVQLHKKKKRYERTWEIGLYNAYNRRNPFFYDISEEKLANGNTKTTLKRYSLFPVLPSVSYNFKF